MHCCLDKLPHDTPSTLQRIDFLHLDMFFAQGATFHTNNQDIGALQTLEKAETLRGTKLLDDLDDVKAFAKQVLFRTHLAWSVHIGGGNSYKCSLYAQSNAQQMCATELDMLKAELLKSESSLTLHCMQ